MKWNRFLPAEAEHGAIRKRLVFAWKPTLMTDNETVVWFECYEVHEEYRKTGRKSLGGWSTIIKIAVP